MTISKGTVSINGTTGAVSGGGAARYVFDIYWPKIEAKLPDGLPTSAVVSSKRAIAELCNDLVAPLIDYIKNNAEVSGGSIT